MKEGTMTLEEIMACVQDGQPIFGREGMDGSDGVADTHAILVLRQIIPALTDGIRLLVKQDIEATEAEVDWYAWKLTRHIEGLWGRDKRGHECMKLLGVTVFQNPRHALGQIEKVRVFSSPEFGRFVDIPVPKEAICPRCGCCEHFGSCD